MAIEIFTGNGQMRDVLTFSPEEIAELSDERKARLDAVVQAKKELDVIDAAIIEAAEDTKDAVYQRDTWKELFQARFTRTFMQEWAAQRG